MFCTNCGKPLSENGKFCTSCGTASGKKQQPTVVNEVAKAEVMTTAIPEVVSAPAGLNCPNCRSKNTHTSIEQNISGGGFSAGKSCLGFLFLGPLGLLCGACGRSVKTQTNTAVLCNDCGNKFKTPHELTNDIRNACLGITIFPLILLLVIIVINPILLSFGNPWRETIWSMSAGVLGIGTILINVIAIPIYVYKIFKTKRELKKIQNAQV